ncbi:hypothetical protein EVAR_32701_1 [Eumeta japonica]|uniref:Uncharacterized protein n=1 Tax=Eumeta variegata TaxID=151549 RepID=A0A4C1VNI3_EUMVA|nr:hypothetical protein EVAR_32701_1 [Eumeta japonica]
MCGNGSEVKSVTLEPKGVGFDSDRGRIDPRILSTEIKAKLRTDRYSSFLSIHSSKYVITTDDNSYSLTSAPESNKACTLPQSKRYLDFVLPLLDLWVSSSTAAPCPEVGLLMPSNNSSEVVMRPPDFTCTSLASVVPHFFAGPRGC